MFDLNDVSSVVFHEGATSATVFMKSHSLNHTFSGADAQALWGLFSAKGKEHDGEKSPGV